MIELERTFLAKNIPSELMDCKYKEIIDIYIPKEDIHPKLRIRKNGDKFELTKKQPIDNNDNSKLNEETIILNEREFNSLSKINGKRVHKLRYYYDYNGRIAEFDIFLDELKGLVLIDFEFETEREKNDFQMPDFCLVDVTQDDFIAGGILCGKSYRDIEEDLKKYNYNKINQEI
jgi:CYTH domain-containing protein